MSAFGDKIIYVLDTNTFRYETDPGAHAAYKEATNQFWLKVKDELLNQSANLYTPNEVLRELEVQFFGLRATEKEDIRGLLRNQIVIPDNVFNIELEHHIRKMSAYVRSKFNILIGADFEMLPKKVNYPAVSDARILLSAYIRGGILVTSNIKDFILYPLLFEANEQKLLNLLDGSFKQLSPSNHNTISSDTDFVVMKNELDNLIEQNNPLSF